MFTKGPSSFYYQQIPKIEFDGVWVEMHEFIPLFVFKQEVKEILTEDRIQDEWYVVQSSANPEKSQQLVKVSTFH